MKQIGLEGFGFPGVQSSEKTMQKIKEFCSRNLAIFFLFKFLCDVIVVEVILCVIVNLVVKCTFIWVISTSVFKPAFKVGSEDSLTNRTKFVSLHCG